MFQKKNTWTDHENPALWSAEIKREAKNWRLIIKTTEKVCQYADEIDTMSAIGEN